MLCREGTKKGKEKAAREWSSELRFHGIDQPLSCCVVAGLPWLGGRLTKGSDDDGGEEANI